MAKIQVTENRLKQIIRESVERILEEKEINYASQFQPWKPKEPVMMTPPPAGETTKPQQTTKPRTSPPNVTYGPDGKPVRPMDKYLKQEDDAANSALQAWNALGTTGQIKAIQMAAGIPENECDGKIGPQTLGKVFSALGKTVMGVNAANLKNVKWVFNKKGTYRNTLPGA